MVRKTDLVTIITLMVIITKDNGKMTENMAEVFTLIYSLERSIMENGSMDLKKAEESSPSPTKITMMGAF